MAQYGVFQYGTDQYGLGQPETAATGAPFLGYRVNVDAITRAVATPVGKTVFNQYDEMGLLLALQRLTTETNWEYRRRLRDVFSNVANSTYRGLVNGITRELGLSLYYPIVINPKINPTTERFLAPDPYVLFDGVWLYLYSDYKNGVLDFQIDRYQSGGNFEHILRLVEHINDTYYFEANILGGIDPYSRSMTIVNQSNRGMVDVEDIPNATIFHLEHDRLIEGSVFFNNGTVFNTRVSSSSLVTSAGKYHIDYHSGIITVGSVPPVGTTVRYQYNIYPFKPIASPVILHDINNDNFRVKMFEQVLQEDETYAHGVPTEIGVDIINELMSVTPMYWGV